MGRDVDAGRCNFRRGSRLERLFMVVLDLATSSRYNQFKTSMKNAALRFQCRNTRILLDDTGDHDATGFTTSNMCIRCVMSSGHAGDVQWLRDSANNTKVLVVVVCGPCVGKA